MALTWLQILNTYQQYVALQHEHRHDDSSLPFYNAIEERGLVNYGIGDDGIYVWEGNDQAKVEISDPENVMIYINVYHVERCCGGMEEGGWYYDDYTSELVVPLLAPEDVCPFEHAVQELERWSKRYNNDGRRPLSSVLSNGEYRLHIEMLPKESETTEVPHYC